MRAGVVGMGIMGRLLGLALHNAGWQVTLFDKNSGDTNCSFAAAGLLTPVSELDKAELLIFKLGQESLLSCWPAILEQLPDSIYFQNTGTLVINHPSDQAEWNYYSRRIASQLRQCDAHFQLCPQATLTQLEPDLAKFETAYYFPEEAHIATQDVMAALRRYLEAQGVACLTDTPVISLVPQVVITQTEQHQFDLVLDCRGLGACAVYPDLRALRGELIWLHAPEVNLQRPVRFLHPRYSLYIVPRPGNIYLIGASEIEADDESAISVRTTLELLTAAYSVHSGFAEARIVKTVTHSRPTLANHLPRIKFTEGLLAVNGLYRHGYLIAPALALEIVRSLKSNHQLRHYPAIWEH